MKQKTRSQLYTIRLKKSLLEQHDKFDSCSMIAIQKIGIVNSVIRLPIDPVVDVKFGSQYISRDQMGAAYDC